RHGPAAGHHPAAGERPRGSPCVVAQGAARLLAPSEGSSAMSVGTQEGKPVAMRVRHAVRWCWLGPWTVLTWLVAGGRWLFRSAWLVVKKALHVVRGCWLGPWTVLTWPVAGGPVLLPPAPVRGVLLPPGVAAPVA